MTAFFPYFVVIVVAFVICFAIAVWYDIEEQEIADRKAARAGRPAEPASLDPKIIQGLLSDVVRIDGRLDKVSKAATAAALSAGVNLDG